MTPGRLGLPSSFPPLGDFPSDGPFRYTHLNDAALHFSFPILCFYLPAIVAADLFLARQPRSFIPERVTLRFACGRTREGGGGTTVRNVLLCFAVGVLAVIATVIKFPFRESAGAPPPLRLRPEDGLTREISAVRRQFAFTENELP